MESQHLRCDTKVKVNKLLGPIRDSDFGIFHTQNLKQNNRITIGSLGRRSQRLVVIERVPMDAHTRG